MSLATVAISGSIQGSIASSAELRADKRGAYYALMKNPDHYVQYQQAQQQTEEDDLDLNHDQDDEITEHDDNDELDQEVIHL